MSRSYLEILENNQDVFVAINNILTEAAWFYKSDDPELFYFLSFHENDFREFYQDNFKWELRIDSKCARLIKDKVYNPALGSGIVEFKLRGRDEYIAFLLLIEFYEKLLSEQSLAATDRENPTFMYGEYLEYVTDRMRLLFPERADINHEFVRTKILRSLMEKLINYRFIKELPKDIGTRIEQNRVIYEALPSCYHYNAYALEKNLEDLSYEN